MQSALHNLTCFQALGTECKEVGQEEEGTVRISAVKPIHCPVRSHLIQEADFLFLVQLGSCVIWPDCQLENKSASPQLVVQ